MKSLRLLLTAALSLVAMQSFAQAPMDAFRAMFSESAVSIDALYGMDVRQTSLSGDMQISVQGNMYHMKGNGLELYCNGETVWTIDEQAREVVVESVSDLSELYMSNPVLVLADLDRYFKVMSHKSVKGLTEYELKSVADCGIVDAILVLSSDGMMVSGEFALEDGNVLSVKVRTMKKTEEMPLDSFSPKNKFSSDWVVTDLR